MYRLYFFFRWSFDSDPYGSNSSQESGQLAILTLKNPLIGGNLENREGGSLRISKKPRNSFDFESYGLDFSQESQELAIFPPKIPVNGADLKIGDGIFQKPKKVKNGNKKGVKLKEKSSFSVPVEQTKTLMETQEFREMMEHEDEVYFALDGLRKGQPVRIGWASLLSLLSICKTAQQRQLLRTNGTVKTILDAVMGLSFDDLPINLAAEAFFFILISDTYCEKASIHEKQGQEDRHMDSPSYIRFLMKMLKPLTSDTSKDRAPSIGSKMLALRRDASCLQDTDEVDLTSAAIFVKVQELLIGCKQMKSRDGEEKEIVKEKPEVGPRWISLLTMEKACLSTISFDDATGNVRRTGGNFKEKFREHRGLDAVFDITGHCHLNIKVRTCMLHDINCLDLDGIAASGGHLLKRGKNSRGRKAKSRVQKIPS